MTSQVRLSVNTTILSVYIGYDVNKCHTSPQSTSVLKHRLRL